MAGWFKQYPPNTPVRQVANIKENNLIRAILDDLQGIGCRVIKPKGLMGRGWRIVVDGASDVDPIPDSYVGSDTWQVPVKPYDIDGKISLKSSHPFKVIQVAENKVIITPGFCAAMGASSHVPTFADTSNPITNTPSEEKTISGSSLVLLHVNYDADEVWQSTEILIAGTSFDYESTYTDGYILLATIAWSSGKISNIAQGVTSSLAHSKCNIYHNWTATGQVPASISGPLTLPAAATDPTGVGAGYVYYNTTSGTVRLHNSTAWVTL